uniref:Gustatory receptor n=1 Tax=Protaetia brevitarsis TaxID=348688 RepID=A0A411HR63_PROBE|nr:gustatory receptor [Protaetia brevitarsis]
MVATFMVKPSRDTNIRYITPLFKLCTLLCIIPPYDFRNYKFTICIKYRIYRALVLVFLLGGAVYCFISKVLYTFDMIQNTVVVVNVLAYISFFLINVTSVTSANFNNFKSLDKFMNELVSIDRKLLAYHITNKTKTSTWLWLEIFLNHVVLFFVMLFDGTLWYLASDNKFHFYMLYENLQKYHTHILSHLMVNLIICLKHRYRIANNLLAEAVKQRDVVNISTKILFKPYKDVYTVKNVIKIFIGLNRMIEYFNKIYGWTLLCIHINIIASLLVSLDFIIEFSSESNILRDKYGLEFILLMSMWSLMALCLGIFLASTANSTINEAQNTSNVSYKLLQYVPPSSTNPHDRELREDLLLLSEQSSLRTPCFTAAGFFNVDYTMLFTLLSSITSYLVVLIQFSN